MKNKKALLLINDKEYRVVGGSTSCSVNYNQFFAPLSDRFYQVHLVGRLDAGTESYPFPITNVRFYHQCSVSWSPDVWKLLPILAAISFQ